MRALLWDMDGSLINSEPFWEIATYECSERLGRRLTPELRATCVGNTLRDTVAICAAHAGVPLDDDVVKQESNFLENRVIELVRENGVVWLPGVRDIIAEAHAESIPVVLVTNTRRKVATPCIEAMGEHMFTATVCGDDVPHGKPAPDPYLRGVEIAGFRPQECLALEDSATGTRSALAAQCEVLWIPMEGAPPPADAITALSPFARHYEGTLEGWRLADLRAAFACDLKTWNNRPSEEL
ncbi:HAD family hydrolase [Corynebacterium sp. H113]|uniref:HAD family hydrolase n=1 Tax=Corynebacterium sp. H113 TaxID=3133419 RepID=UPI00309C71A2